MKRLWGRLRAFWLLLELIPWTCYYCQERNETSRLLWADLRYRLICRQCRFQQNYPEWIYGFDPDKKAEAKP